MVRQRKSIVELRCTVCGAGTPPDDRWWFRLGSVTDGYFMTTEAPVHWICADHALQWCPRLRGHREWLEPLPSGYSVMSAIVGGPAVEQDFGLKIDPARGVIGHLKLAWPAHRIRIAR